MDAVSELLGQVRARGAVFRQTIMRPPWALRMASGAPLTLAMMARGRAWIVPERGEPVAVGVGDIAVVRGDAPYTVADDPATVPAHVVTSADYCPTADGIEPAGGRAGGTCEPLGARRDGAPGRGGAAGDGGGPDRGGAAGAGGNPDHLGAAGGAAPVLVSGAFEGRGELSERLLRALPAVLVVPADGGPYPSVEVVADEVARNRPGQQLVLDRTLDLLLVAALRRWFDDPGAGAPAWCRALDDPLVGRALRLLHDAPERPWTVADLAAGVGVSRAALARRFTALVGEPPMAYLAGWRVALAADLLRETDQTVDAIARRVGYANAFALSVAFKRLRGTRPSDHRDPPPAWRATAGAGAG
ncbi:AraC family transcriptional regulator [Streptomyces sp. 71268]|uniref:AraC family transcriptional regulator n=1 Tax=Streptomyces sp. 71268 TaxID=3002640 RepID=UPI0023F8F6E8|nr:AraC family transcriptional regulator [Streptomyces sp. 71268]WEV26405.1 AraC family transcriptional regulator [Streptomyces sp. 71268]